MKYLTEFLNTLAFHKKSNGKANQFHQALDVHVIRRGHELEQIFSIHVAKFGTPCQLDNFCNGFALEGSLNFLHLLILLLLAVFHNLLGSSTKELGEMNILFVKVFRVGVAHCGQHLGHLERKLKFFSVTNLCVHVRLQKDVAKNKVFYSSIKF